jgi:hypothetical protein
VRLGIPHGKEKKCLIRVRQDDLFDVIGLTGEPGKRARSRFDRFNASLAFADIAHEHSVPDSDEVSPAPLTLEDTLDRGEQLATVRQCYGEVLAVGADYDARQRARRWSRVPD